MKCSALLPVRLAPISLRFRKECKNRRRLSQMKQMKQQKLTHMFNIMTTNVPIIRSALWARAAILGVRGLLGISTLAFGRHFPSWQPTKWLGCHAMQSRMPGSRILNIWQRATATLQLETAPAEGTLDLVEEEAPGIWSRLSQVSAYPAYLALGSAAERT